MMSEQLLVFRFGPGEAVLSFLIYFVSIFPSILELEVVNQISLDTMDR